jgi:hypothetical protein
VNLYEQYKPFRNYTRRFARFPSLVHLWAYSKHIVDGVRLEPNLAVGMPLSQGELKTHLHPWDLEILVREIIIHAHPTSGDLDIRRWNDLATAVNHIRRMDEFISKHCEARNDLLLELHRMAHRQFRWQTGLDLAAIIRVIKIFGADAIDALVLEEFGMTTKQFVLLGTAIAGSFISRWSMSTNTDYSILGIAREASARLFQRITCDIEELRTLTTKSQSYDDSWLYAWNPLERHPLIRFDPRAPNRVICPIPKYLLSRASTGIFYDIVNSRGFDNPYGRSFQTYIGEVLSTTCKPPRFTLLAENEYSPTKAERKDGVDWILSDATGHLFVECKTKRLSLGAKNLTNLESLQNDLHVMAHTVVQNYKNIRDALNGYTRWVSNGFHIYPLIVTLEDWYLFNPRLQEMLRSYVARFLFEAKINANVLAEMPYTIASARDFEAAAQIIATVGVFGLMSKKIAAEQRQMALFPFLQTMFTEELRSAQGVLFPEEVKRLVPDNDTNSNTALN